MIYNSCVLDLVDAYKDELMNLQDSIWRRVQPSNFHDVTDYEDIPLILRYSDIPFLDNEKTDERNMILLYYAIQGFERCRDQIDREYEGEYYLWISIDGNMIEDEQLIWPRLMFVPVDGPGVVKVAKPTISTGAFNYVKQMLDLMTPERNYQLAESGVSTDHHAVTMDFHVVSPSDCRRMLP